MIKFFFAHNLEQIIIKKLYISDISQHFLILFTVRPEVFTLHTIQHFYSVWYFLLIVNRNVSFRLFFTVKNKFYNISNYNWLTSHNSGYRYSNKKVNHNNLLTISK